MHTSERIDTVNDSIRLIQRKDGLTFGTDALLLAAYVKGGAGCSALEFGTGTGIVSLLCATRKKAAKILAVEVQSEFADIARRNVEQNGLTGTVEIAYADIRDLSAYGGDGVDLLFTNPPYMTVGGGYPNTADVKNIARHEVVGDISDFCVAAGKKLRFGGRFYCVYRPDRAVDLLCAMRDAKIEPKRLTFVLADAASSPSMLLVEGKLGAAPSLICTPPLILYTDASHTVYTDDMNYILNNGNFPEKEAGCRGKRM
jgi:tRNA1Val (adenine37-N6)-methyltransferase